MTTRLFKTLSMTLFLVLFKAGIFQAAPFQGQLSAESYIPHSGESIFDRLQQMDLVEMTLKANLDSLINVRTSDEYSKANLSYLDEFGVIQKYNIKVRPRGKFRRRVCDVPPLKIKVSKKQLEAAGLSEHNDMKLVTHCLEDENFNENLVLREYLSYKLYNELTPYSFRVQLVKITYQDVQDESYKMERFGFLIEDVDELAERLEAEECEDCYGLSVDEYHKSAERITSVFQFMIGNVDWSTEMNRNVKQFRLANGNIVPVPYDFDFSVFVNAPYLRPNSNLEQSNNMERIFLGQATKVEEIYGTLSYFKTKRKDLIKMVRGFGRLSREDRNEIELYLESFFKQIYNKEAADNLFFSKESVPVK